MTISADYDIIIRISPCSSHCQGPYIEVDKCKIIWMLFWRGVVLLILEDREAKLYLLNLVCVPLPQARKENDWAILYAHFSVQNGRNVECSDFSGKVVTSSQQEYAVPLYELNFARIFLMFNAIVNPRMTENHRICSCKFLPEFVHYKFCGAAWVQLCQGGLSLSSVCMHLSIHTC